MLTYAPVQVARISLNMVPSIVLFPIFTLISKMCSTISIGVLGSNQAPTVQYQNFLSDLNGQCI